jgi:hypothetical protein
MTCSTFYRFENQGKGRKAGKNNPKREMTLLEKGGKNIIILYQGKPKASYFFHIEKLKK